MVIVSSELSVITLNINGLNSSIKICRVAGWIKTQDSIISCSLETHFIFKDKNRWKVKGWNKILYKWELKERRGSYTYIRQRHNRQRRALYNDKGINPTRGYSIYTCFWSNIAAPKDVQQVLAHPKGGK